MSKADEVRQDARDKAKTFGRHMLSGFVMSALGVGALGPQGKNKLPAKIGPIPFDLGSGALALWYARKGMTKKHAYALGYGFQALAGGLRSLGADLSTRY